MEKVVAQYGVYESDLQKILTSIRGKVIVPAEDLYNVFSAVAEAYPDLKASELFGKLSVSLVDTEERIAFSRSFYNSAVTAFNTYIQSFPYSIIAWFGHIKPVGLISLSGEVHIHT